MKEDLMQMHFKKEYLMQIYFALKEEKKKKRIFSVISFPNVWVIFLYHYRSCIWWNM